MESHSSPYAHIFQWEPEIPWPKLKANNCLSKLHAKYWGKDIREDSDMHQWQEKQTRGSRDQPMNTAQSNVSPANFALYFDIDSDAFNTLRMWVREDYVLLYDYCTTYFNQSKIRPLSGPPSIVITGQPGIGKSYWIFYAARRRLGEKHPFVWYFGLEWYLFLEDGVFRCPEQFSTIPFRQLGLWVLVDADHSNHGVPPEVAQSGSKLHTIFTTCPRRDRWKALRKTTSCSTVIMNPWSWDEIYQAAIVHKFTPGEINEARRAFTNRGPTAHLCVDFVQNPGQLSLYESLRCSALASLSIKGDLIKAVGEICGLKFDDIHTLFLLRRVEGLNPGDKGYLQYYTVEPITPYVKQEVMFKLMTAEQEERSIVYELLKAVPASRPRPVANVAFESIAQLRLQNEVTLTLVPMVKQPPTSSRRIAVWKSQPVGEPVPMSTEDSGPAGAIAANETLSISFKPDETVQYQKSQLGPVRPSIFYIPRPSNQDAAFSSFIVDNRILYIFQIPNATSHTIKGEIMDFFSQQSLQTILQGIEWRFIFVIPRGGEIECPESSDDRLKGFWKKVKLFSAEFDPRNKDSSWFRR